jgi:photosystem II stability/assembly factor-like uncharacterized protein
MEEAMQPTPSRHGLRLAAALVVLPGLWRATLGPRPGHHGLQVPALDTVITNALTWRSIGPDRGGRSIAISGVRGRPDEAYFGATGGGLWKTTDRGETWKPVTDGQVTSASVGAVAVSETNPDIVFIGMGESCIRGDIMAGDGVYKSTDAGKTWKHVWTDRQTSISKIRIDPVNPDIVYMAVLGRYGSPSSERGIYKSTDGGEHWRKVLFRDDSTGGVDISIDRTNPKVIYAALWTAGRTEWTMWSGGSGSGLFKSTDAGEHWTEITRNPGLPQGIDGKIGVSVSGADPNRVYAEVENEQGGLFRSDDAGATWTLVNDSRNIRQRAFYYTHVTADPHNKDLVYVQNVGTYRSTDGGKTLSNFAGGDSHDIWIDPDDSNHFLYASDGGGAITYDALGAHTFTARDYPTAQLYHVVATAHVPYHVCGAQQDASTVCVPSTGAGGGRGGRGGAPQTYSPGGAEPGYIAPDPLDPDVFYAGSNNGGFLERLNRRTGESREVNPYPRMFSGEPSSALVERWQWTYPIVFSPVDPHVLYTASQHVWRTTNGGQTWDRISGDLTRHDPKTMGPSGGPITHDMNGPEVYAVVFALGPSKRNVNVLWAGSDDGLVQVTRDGGKHWANVTPKEMPDFGRVSIIDAGRYDDGTAYVAVKRPLLDDPAPYIFRTHDFGKTWTKIVTGIAPDDYVHTVREDITRPGLLYAGTQHGVYVSHDDGDHWTSLSLNLPDAPVSDLIVASSSLAISTHGRGFYILDNIQPLRQFTPAIAASDAPHLFAPAPAIRGAGAARIEYWLKRAADSLTIEILDSRGAVLETMVGADVPPGGGRGGRGGGRGGFGGRGGGGNPSKAPGLHDVSWSLRYPGATTFPGMILWGATTAGPVAVPGDYQVRLTVDGRTMVRPLQVKAHPLHTDVTQADLQEQFDLAIRIRDKVSEANQAVIDIRRIRDTVAARMKASPDSALQARGRAVNAALTPIEEAIYQVRNRSGQDPLNFPIKLNNRLASLLGVVEDGDGKPIGNAPLIFRDLAAELKVQTDALAAAMANEIAAFNREARRLGLPEVTAPGG